MFDPAPASTPIVDAGRLAVPAKQPVVEVRRLTKRYGEMLAVDALSFTLEPGTVTGFLGPNGAGKSTTIRLLLGLSRPTEGDAFLFGRPYGRLDRPCTRVGAVLESTDFDPGRSGRDHPAPSRSPHPSNPRASMRCSNSSNSSTRRAGRCAGTRWGCASDSGSPQHCSAIRSS